MFENKVSNRGWIKNNLSMIFLLIVLVITVLLYLYNISLTNNTKELSQKILDRKSDIIELKKDKNIDTYIILEKNKLILERMDKFNKINTYIDHLKQIEIVYNLEFKGFHFNNGKLNSNVSIKSTDKNLAFQLTRDFISKYREDEKALFDLNFINSVTGMDNMRFNVNFELK